jgi:hypothetical protein
MKFKWVLAILLIITIFLSGCEEKELPVEEFKDDALKFEYEIKEEIEKERILPGQTVRMVIYLTSQVPDDIKNAYIKITNPYGIKIDDINCYRGNCICNWEDPNSPYFNGCYINKIISKDLVEVYFSLKMPTEEEISPLGRDLKPELTLKYEYKGASTLYIPILRETEQPPTGITVESTQTKGPIHVDLKSDKWVRSESFFPLLVDVKDVISLFSQHQTIIDKNNFHLYITHLSMINSASESFENSTSCSGFYPSNDTCSSYDLSECNGIECCTWEDSCVPKLCSLVSDSACTDCAGCYAFSWIPKNKITVPMKNPLVATLKAELIVSQPMVRAMIRAEYGYTYEKKVIKTIRVEKALA